jgi:hypothetical protein
MKINAEGVDGHGTVGRACLFVCKGCVWFASLPIFKSAIVPCTVQYYLGIWEISTLHRNTKYAMHTQQGRAPGLTWPTTESP